MLAPWLPLVLLAVSLLRTQRCRSAAWRRRAPPAEVHRRNAIAGALPAPEDPKARLASGAAPLTACHRAAERARSRGRQMEQEEQADAAAQAVSELRAKIRARAPVFRCEPIRGPGRGEERGAWRALAEQERCCSTTHDSITPVGHACVRAHEPAALLRTTQSAMARQGWPATLRTTDAAGGQMSRESSWQPTCRPRCWDQMAAAAAAAAQ